MRRKFAHIEEKTQKELASDITKAKIELLNLRMQHARGMLKNPLLIREKRRLVARFCTMLTIKEGASNA